MCIRDRYSYYWFDKRRKLILLVVESMVKELDTDSLTGYLNRSGFMHHAESLSLIHISRSTSLLPAAAVPEEPCTRIISVSYTHLDVYKRQVLAFTQILNRLSRAGFFWLLIGGIIYTAGGVIYALKLPVFNGRHRYFGSHEIFHLFVMGGSICHFIVMYSFVL